MREVVVWVQVALKCDNNFPSHFQPVGGRARTVARTRIEERVIILEYDKRSNTLYGGTGELGYTGTK